MYNGVTEIFNKGYVMERKGFTLVEIMMVVLIIGALAAMTIPEIIRARETTQRNICINHMVEIRDAIERWALDTNAQPNAEISMSDIVPAYIRREPRCPIGNKPYQLTTVDKDPVVSCPNKAPGHVLPGY